MKFKNIKLNKFLEDDRGISLIELIMAITIFIVGIASIAHLFVSAHMAMSYNLEKAQAILLAKEGLEEQRVKGFGSFQEEEIVFDLNGTDFSREINLNESGDEVEVVSGVSWRSQGRDEEVYFREIFTNWNPTLPSIESLALHLDATLIGLEDEDRVEEWRDISGNDHHFSIESSQAPFFKEINLTGSRLLSLGRVNGLKMKM